MSDARGELSQSEIYRLLSAAVTGGKVSSNTLSSTWIREVYSTYFIYCDDKTPALYRRDYIIGENLEVTLGQPIEVKERTTYEPLVRMAAFSLGSADDTESSFSSEAGEDYIIRTGKVFECGDYPDKSFALTPEELDIAIAKFQPADIDIEHRPSVLDGRLGKLKSVSKGDDGKSLIGQVAIPKWLHAALGNEPLKVSTTWTREPEKLISKLALVLSPRIPDAALFTAYTANFEGKRHSQSDYTALQEIHDATARLGANCSQEFNQTNKEFTLMSENTQTQNPPAVTVATDIEAQLTAMRAEFTSQIEAERKRNVSLSAKLRRTEAVTFADAEIVANRATPAERKMLIEFYEQSALDDENDSKPLALATFGQSGQPNTRVSALKALYAARTPHSFTTEEVQVSTDADGNNPAVFGANGRDPAKDKETAKPDPDRIKKLLAMTSVGELALNRGGK